MDFCRRRDYLTKGIFVAWFLLTNATALAHRSLAVASTALAKASQGYIAGEVVPEGAIFRGIPFSQPPVGSYRWRNPRIPLPYQTKYWNGTYYRPGCPQICHTLRKKYVCPSVISEDCLYLNIWVPRRLLHQSHSTSVLTESHYIVAENFRKQKANSLAVMFYLHGGNFKLSAGSALLYDSRFLANQGDVIVVTSNYRLGALGFLVQGDSLGNFGIHDQIRALQWVKKNIINFGGNPDKITVFGQSSGAESVGILLTSQYGKGLFQQAIMQSNPLSLPYRTLSEARLLGNKLAKKFGCRYGDIECLKKITATKILKESTKLAKFSLESRGKVLYAFQEWGPVIDGKLIPELPLYSFMKGNYHRMPLIVGNDKNDGYLFVMMVFHKSLGMLMYDIIVEFITGTYGSSILKQYPACLLCDNRKHLSHLATDYAFLCPSRRFLFGAGPDTWSYLFDATLPFKGVYKNDICTKEVCHGAEVTYIFDTVFLTNFTFNGLEQNLSQKMQYYWSNFAKYGNPNGQRKNRPTHVEYWNNFPDVKHNSYNVMEMRKDGNIMLKNPYQSKCDFWDKLNAYGKI